METNHPWTDEMTEVIKGMSSWKAVGPDGLPAELPTLGHPELIQCFHNMLVKVWITGEVPQQSKYAIKALHEKE